MKGNLQDEGLGGSSCTSDGRFGTTTREKLEEERVCVHLRPKFRS